MSSLIPPIVSRAMRTFIHRSAFQAGETLSALTLFDHEALITSPTKSTCGNTFEEVTRSLPVIEKESHRETASRNCSRVSLSCYDRTNDAMGRFQKSGYFPVVFSSLSLQKLHSFYPYRNRMFSTIAQSQVGMPSYYLSSTCISQVRSRRLLTRSFSTQSSKEGQTSGDSAGGHVIKTKPFSFVNIGDRWKVSGGGVLLLAMLYFAGYMYCEEETEGAFCSGVRDSIPDWVPFPKKK